MDTNEGRYCKHRLKKYAGIDEYKADILVPLFACILCILCILGILYTIYYVYYVPSTGQGSLPARHLFVWLGV